MALNHADRSKIEKKATSEGYKWNATGEKMIKSNGGSLKFSDTAKSVNLNGIHYNSSADAKKSKGW